ncbi:hypothetical protein Hhel01_03367 [Haloferula helveola]
MEGTRKCRRYWKERELERGEEERAIRDRAWQLRLTPIDRTKLHTRSVMGSFGVPCFVGRYYLDWRFTCRDCGKAEVWTGAQQKWWFEDAGGEMEQIAIRCRNCRRKERERKAEARRVHFEGLERKRRMKAEKS